MSVSKLILAGLVALASLILSGVVHAAPTARAAHPTSASCGSCHVSGSDTQTGPAPRLIAAQEVLCTKCHEQAAQLSHPSGFAPRRSLPAEFPLDWKGDLTCSTCHLVHGLDPGLLRGKKRGKEFCLLCHDAAFFRNMKDAGTSLVISGHLDIGRGRGTIDIDAHSLHCLGCHASSHSGGGSVSISRNGVVRHASGSAPHPIGRSYKEASSRGGFQPEHQLLQKKIILSNGKISCISCHEAYKKDHGKLVASLDRSALCLACHAK